MKRWTHWKLVLLTLVALLVLVTHIAAWGGSNSQEAAVWENEGPSPVPDAIFGLAVGCVGVLVFVRKKRKDGLHLE